MKSKKQKSTGSAPSKVSTITDLGNGFVKLTHSQSIRQSVSYQSAEAQYGIEAICAKDTDAIEEAFLKMEKAVEEPLLVKFKEHGRILNQLARGRD